MELIEIITRSVYVSGAATLLSFSLSIPIAYLIASSNKLDSLSAIFEALVGVPTVFIGLSLYMLFSKKGPLGFLGLLYTPQAIIIGEAVLITPLIVSISYRAFKASIESYAELALSLGASEPQAALIAIREALGGLIAAGVMGFSRAIGELGVALLVGGNIKGYTRTITTAIALEVSRGEFEDAIILGVLLISIVVSVSLAAKLLARRGGAY